MTKESVTVKLATSGLKKLDELKREFHVNRSVVIRAALSVAMNHPRELRERLARFEEI